MLQATFRPFAVSSMPLITSGAVSNRTWISAEKVWLSACCIALCCSDERSKALRTSTGSDDIFRALARSSFASLFQLSQATDEHIAHAFFQRCPSEIGKRLSRDGKNFLPGSAGDFVVQALLFAFQRVLSFGAQGVGRLPRLIEKTPPFGFRLFRRLAQECATLAVELLVLFLELFALLFGLGSFCVGIRDFLGDPLLPRVDGVEDGLVEKALHGEPLFKPVAKEYAAQLAGGAALYR